LEGKQERRREVERKEGEQRDTGFKVKQSGGIQANTVMASSLAKEAGDALIVGSNRICSNGRSRENKCGDGKLSTEGRVSSKEPTCYGCGQESK